MVIYCTGCHANVDARLTDGREIYPSRHDLVSIPFWVCDACGALVGTHHKTKDRTKPLGFLATPEIRRWRMRIHQILDPLWKNKLIQRGNLYRRVSQEIGHNYHNGKIYDVEEAQEIYRIVKRIKDTLDPHHSPWNN